MGHSRDTPKWGTAAKGWGPAGHLWSTLGQAQPGYSKLRRCKDILRLGAAGKSWKGNSGLGSLGLGSASFGALPGYSAVGHCTYTVLGHCCDVCGWVDNAGIL